MSRARLAADQDEEPESGRKTIRDATGMSHSDGSKPVETLVAQADARSLRRPRANRPSDGDPASELDNLGRTSP